MFTCSTVGLFFLYVLFCLISAPNNTFRFMKSVRNCVIMPTAFFSSSFFSFSFPSSSFPSSFPSTKPTRFKIMVFIELCLALREQRETEENPDVRLCVAYLQVRRSLPSFYADHVVSISVGRQQFVTWKSKKSKVSMDHTRHCIDTSNKNTKIHVRINVTVKVIRACIFI